MRNHGGFVDLQIGHGGRGAGDDSVWPSFTDIMTVIVMIFLLALAVIMLRNIELDRQLVTSLDAEQAVTQENRALTGRLGELAANLSAVQQSLGESRSERDDLRVQLLDELRRIELLAADKVSLEQQLTDIITQRNLLAQEKQQLGEREAAARQQVADLTKAEAELNRKLAGLNTQFNALEIRTGKEIETLTGENLSLSEQLAAVAHQLQQVQSLLRDEKQQSAAQAATVAELTEAIRRRRAENAALQKLTDESGLRYRSLQEEFDALDAKYRGLVRPARSSAGKHVVAVRIIKTGDGNSDSDYRYQLEEPAQAAVDYAGKDELLARLADIKDKFGQDLYTKIIIPENSRLSHSEAWRFTEEILQGYDYYYRPTLGAE